MTTKNRTTVVTLPANTMVSGSARTASHNGFPGEGRSAKRANLIGTGMD
ncbi:hypothetical protein L0156_11660 [bacterium]|nr:hypothetical protein [bacterium]